jgi:cytochrome P450
LSRRPVDVTLPTSAIDLFRDDLLAEPYDAYAELRDQGPVVHLPHHDLYAVARYAEARAVLDDPVTFCSGQGVGLNDLINLMGQGTTLMSDGEAHERQRDVIGRPLTPRALADLRSDVQALAEDLVDRLAATGSFDAVTDLAQVIPTTWVPELLGWPTEGRSDLLRWASDNFDALGPDNARCAAAGPGVVEMAMYARDVAERGDLPAGSMAAGVLAAAERGDINADQCPMLLVDYLAPSLDTTVSALGNAIWLFGRNPEQWELLRSEPERVKAAFNEVLRLESPISCFTRMTTTDTDLGGAHVPAGARVLVLFASANRDERRWNRADESTSRANPPATSDSGTASTRARAWASRASKATPCSPRWQRASPHSSWVRRFGS